MAAGIQKQLAAAVNAEAVKSVFEVARTNLARRRTPEVEGPLSELMAEYEALLKKAMEDARATA